MRLFGLNAQWLCTIFMASTFIIQVPTGLADPEAMMEPPPYQQRLWSHPTVQEILTQAQMHEALSSSELGLPDPQIILGVDNLPIEDPVFDQVLPSSKVLGFRQQIPSKQLRQTRSDMHDSLVSVHELKAQYQYQKLNAELIAHSVGLARVRQLHNIKTEQLQLYRLMEKDLRGRLEAGQAVYGRLSEIDVKRSMVSQLLNDLHGQRAVIEENLVALVLEVPSVDDLSVEQRPWTRDQGELYPVLIAAAQAQTQATRVKAAQARYRPNVGVQAIYKQREAGDRFTGEDWFSLQATISVPLWSKQNQAPQVRAAQAEHAGARAAQDQTVRYWTAQMAGMQAKIDALALNIQQLKSSVNALEQVIKTAQRHYESGRSALESVLTAQIALLDIKSEMVTQESTYKATIASFNSHIPPQLSPVAGGSHAN